MVQADGRNAATVTVALALAVASGGGRACAARRSTASPVAATACAAGGRASILCTADRPTLHEVRKSSTWRSVGGHKMSGTVRLASSWRTVCGPEPDLLLIGIN